jgi:serine/threonine protein kinase
MTNPSNLVKNCNCGASGCVLYPGLACEKNACSNSDSSKCKKPIATKIFFNPDSYNEETKIYNSNDAQLKKLDPNEDFFLSSYQECKDINEENIRDYNCDYETIDKNVSGEFQIVPDLSMEENFFKQMQFEKEEEKAETNSIFKAINFSYLGEDMEKIRKKLEPKDIPLFLQSLENVFQGIKLLNENGIYHCDIKLQNIVLDKNKFKIIDFGLAIFETPDIVSTMHTAYTQPNKEAFTPGFIAPEFYYHKINQHVAYGFNNPDIKRVGDKIHYDLNLYSMTKQQTMNIAYYEGLDMCPHQTYVKNDIWALGCVLKIILNKILNLMEMKQAEAALNNLPTIAKGLSVVIAKLLTLNVAQRPTPQEALDIYTRFLVEITSSKSSGGRKKQRTLKQKKRNRTKRMYKSKTYRKRAL